MIQYPHKSNIKHHQWSILTHNSKTKLTMIGKLREQELEAATVKKQSTKTLCSAQLLSSTCRVQDPSQGTVGKTSFHN